MTFEKEEEETNILDGDGFDDLKDLEEKADDDDHDEE